MDSWPRSGCGVVLREEVVVHQPLYRLLFIQTLTVRYHVDYAARNAGLVVAECAFVRVEGETTLVAPSPLGVRFGFWLAFESQGDVGGDGVPVELVVVAQKAYALAVFEIFELRW